MNNTSNFKLFLILLLTTSFVITGPNILHFVNAQLEIPEVRTINEDDTSEITTNITETSFLSYSDDSLGFSLEYPETWEIGSGGNAYQIVSFIAPDNTASVYVMFSPRNDDQSLKDFGDEMVKENENFLFDAYYRNSTTLLANQPAFKATGTYLNTVTVYERSLGYDSSNTKTLQIVTLDENNDAFVGIIYHADDQQSYDKYLPLIEHMITSFTLSVSGPVISEDE